MAQKLLALLAIAPLIVIYYYFNSSYKSESLPIEEIVKVEVTTKARQVFHIEEFISNQPNVSSKYPGGFLASPECPAEELELLILVFTAPGNFQRRQAIRENWARDLNNSTRLFFIIGGAEANGKLESETDVVLANFTDSYRNLTLKTVALLDWSARNCKFRFLLKCDDDMYINYPKLRRKLFAENAVFDNKTIIGRLASGWTPVRDQKSKYFLSKEEFPPSLLPDFVSGPAYLITADLVRPLLSAVLAEHWLNLEDVLVTGIVAKYRLGAQLVGWLAFHNDRVVLTTCNAQQLISIHDIKPREQKLVLAARNKTNTRRCKIVP